MNNEEKALKEVLLFKEEQLLDKVIRTNPDKIKELISDDFIEFTSSGKQYFYSAGDTFRELPGKTAIDYNSIILKRICADAALLLYTAAVKQDNERVTISNRCSIWKIIDGSWKIVFHQGTFCK